MCAGCLGGTLLYEIPANVGDDLFTVDSSRGIVTTHGSIDRETQDLYTIPIYVTEISSNEFGNNYSKSKNLMPLYDVATLVIGINDVNDHAPEFRPGTCYPLSVPENHETTIIHTVVATDLDEGLNGDIIYTITGNFYSILNSMIQLIAVLFCLINRNCHLIDVFNEYIFKRPFIELFIFILIFFFLQAAISVINSRLICILAN